jgi:hypothetical protein
MSYVFFVALTLCFAAKPSIALSCLFLATRIPTILIWLKDQVPGLDTKPRFGETQAHASAMGLQQLDTC